jgi:integrase catalytic region (fragment)
MDALAMAQTNGYVAKEAIFNSDRGVHRLFSDYTASITVRLSCGRVGSCYDNATVESLNATIKKELVHRQVFAIKEQAKTAVAAYVEVFYNQQRMHSVLGNKIPAAVVAEFLLGVMPMC